MRGTVLVMVLACLLVVEGGKGKRRRERGRERGLPRAARQRDRSSRGLVPQLLANYSTPAPPPAHEVPCNDAYLACAYRGGCGAALQSYMLNCASLREGVTERCGRQCQLALVALLSTPEGERMMECTCSSPNRAAEQQCLQEKARVEPCREEVTWHTRDDTRVSCTAASWICAADPLCSTAMAYYQDNCKAMFKGRKCGKRCKNSLDIMLRQHAAAKLSTCYCEGSEDFDCAAVRLHTDVLCFGKKVVAEEVENNEVDVAVIASGSRRPEAAVALVSFLASCYVSHLGAAVSNFVLALRS